MAQNFIVRPGVERVRWPDVNFWYVGDLAVNVTARCRWKICLECNSCGMHGVVCRWSSFYDNGLMSKGIVWKEEASWGCWLCCQKSAVWWQYTADWRIPGSSGRMPWIEKMFAGGMQFGVLFWYLNEAVVKGLKRRCAWARRRLPENMACETNAHKQGSMTTSKGDKKDTDE